MSNILSRMTPLTWVMLLLAFSSMIGIMFRIATWRSRPRVVSTPTYRIGCLVGLLVGIAIGGVGGMVIMMYMQAHSIVIR